MWVCTVAHVGFTVAHVDFALAHVGFTVTLVRFVVAHVGFTLASHACFMWYVVFVLLRVVWVSPWLMRVLL